MRLNSILIGAAKVRSYIVLAIFGMVVCIEPTCAQTTSGMTVQFLARGMEPRPKDILTGDKHDPSPGHVFMIITVYTNHGPKEEAYGFYPAKDGRNVIKGPGALRSEFRCGPSDDCDPSHNNLLKRLSEVKDSVTIPITADQRRTIMRDVNKWDTETYKLVTQNCVDFVNDVAKDLGFPTPSRTQSPDGYVRDLRKNVEKELVRRQDEQAKQEAQRLKAEQEAKEEAERLKAEQACISGVWYEGVNKASWSWSFELINNNQMLSARRTDGHIGGTFSKSGVGWVGQLDGSGGHVDHVVFTPSQDCRTVSTNYNWLSFHR